MIRRAGALLCTATATVLALTPAARGAASSPAHVVIVTIPGFGWDTFDRARLPVLHRLIDTGAVAAVSVRSATKGSTPLRGYLTLGAGNRGYSQIEQKPRRDDATGRIALRSSDRFENGTAAEAMARRVATPRAGEIVAPDAPALDAAQRDMSYGTRVGNLGETLAQGGVRRAVVIAADLHTGADVTAMRRGAALAIVDQSGTVDSGTVSGLLRPSTDATFGVQTDPDAFTAAVRRGLASARVIVAEPGETLRADEFAFDATPREAEAQRVAALQRTDAMIGRIAALLTERDTLYVVGVSSPLSDARDHLTLGIGHGAGIRRGWLTSPTTHRAGIVTLTDFAPTVLSDVGVVTPESMSGTPIRSVSSNARDRVATLESLDMQSSFGDRLQGIAAKLVVALLAGVAAALAGAALRGARWRPAAAWLSLAVLAVPPTAYLVRVIPVYRLGIAVASIAMCALVAALATGARLLPVGVRTSALVLVAIAFVFTTGDLLAGAPLQVNNVFGYSPISAGRFYGNSNIAFAVLVATTLIGVFGLLELRRAPRIPAWAVLVFAGVVVIQGLPQFGADFGGVAASVPAMLVAYAVARGGAVRPSRIAAWAAAGAAAAVGVTLLDVARPPQARTHLGRFAAHLFSGGATDVGEVLTRKVQSNLGLLGSSWTWTVAIAVAVVALLLRSNPHSLRDMYRSYRMLSAGVAGTLTAGVIGFVVNDTGIWVLGMTLAYALPVGVLLTIDPGRIGSSDGRAHLQGSPQEAGRRGQGGP